VSRVPRPAGTLALVAIGVAIGVSLPKPRGATVIQEVRPATTADDDDASGLFLSGGTGMFAGQPRVEPPPEGKTVAPSFPWWRFQGLLPSWDDVRLFLGLVRPACDSSSHFVQFTHLKPYIAQFPPAADGSSSPDTVVTGEAIPLCTPRDIATGPDGELYVLDMHPRLSDPAAGLQVLVKVYDRRAAPDDVPARVFAVAADVMAMTVDSSGHLWTSSRSPGGVVRVYGPGAREEPKPVRVIQGWGAYAPSVAGIAVDSRGNSYVSAGDEVVVYPQDAQAGDMPLREIAGPDTFLRQPTDLAIGPGDSLYVLNAVGFWRCHRAGDTPAEVTVTVYPPGAEGNVEPARRIVVVQAKSSGLREPLMDPVGLAVDEAGAVYVSLAWPGSVAVYAPGATGSVSPVRVLRTGGGAPKALAIGENGALYVLTIPSSRVCL